MAPPRSIGTGTVAFGMVSIPIKLFSAAETASAVSFNLLHGKCGSRLKQQYVCPKDGEQVPRDQMVKGYEFAKEQYVTFTDDEIKSMQEEAQRAIEITEFVPLDKVDPIYYDGPTSWGPTRAASAPTGCSRPPCGRPAAAQSPSGARAARCTWC